MKEIEVKILEIDKTQIESRLISLGAKKVFDGKIDAYFFDSADKRLKEKKQTLRLRQHGEKVILTFKEPVIEDTDAKIRNELEIELSDLSSAKELLEKLGFSQYLFMSKNRTSYRLENTQIDIDKYLGEYSYIPEFLEIESETKDEIFKTAELLGYRKEDCKNWSAKDLAKFYSENNNNNPRITIK